jgi:hypothetical protein
MRFKHGVETTGERGDRGAQRHRHRARGTPGFVTVYPCGIDPPLASNLNFVDGQTVPNAVITKVGLSGDVCIFNSQPTQLVADVTGTFP